MVWAMVARFGVCVGSAMTLLTLRWCYAEVQLPAGPTSPVTVSIRRCWMLPCTRWPRCLSAPLRTSKRISRRGLRVPFAFSGVRLHATAATRLHVRLSLTGTYSFRLEAVDPAGAPVISIDTVTLRPMPDTVAQRAAPGGLGEGLLELAWPALPEDSFTAAVALPEWVVVSQGCDQVAAGLHGGPVYTDMTHPDLGRAEVVVWVMPLADPATGTDGLQRVHSVTRGVLTGLQSWLARPETTDTHLVVVTRHAVATSAYDGDVIWLTPRPGR